MKRFYSRWVGGPYGTIIWNCAGFTTWSGIQDELAGHTGRGQELLAQLEHLEDQREDCIFPFLSKLFRDFHSHQARVFLRENA